jgi:hypothetical protein
MEALGEVAEDALDGIQVGARRDLEDLVVVLRVRAPHGFLGDGGVVRGSSGRESGGVPAIRAPCVSPRACGGEPAGLPQSARRPQFIRTQPAVILSSPWESPMNLVERAKRILLTPKTEWEVIDVEPATVGELYTGYIIPLAAIGPIAQFIGYSLIGFRIPFGGGVYRTPIGQGITGAVVGYILGLVGVYVFALIIDALAPTFGGTKNQIQALKVVAYSMTASWLAGIFAIVPGLRWLGLLGLYSLYLLWLGLPVLMKAPKEKATGYTVVAIVVGFVLAIIVATVAGRFMAMPMV